MEQPPLGNIAFSCFIRDGKLMGSKCSGCGVISVPPQPMCNSCFGNRLDWIELSGRGKLESFTCTAVCPPFMAERGYSDANPYCVGIVELEEGASVVALIDGVDGSHPESIETGMPLEISFPGDEESDSYLVFRPAKAA